MTNLNLIQKKKKHKKKGSQMSIDAKLVKTLRERTGAGMMDCKKALVEANGDLDAAVDHLRKAGIAKAEK